MIDASELVPGDIISIKLGDIIPADGRLTGKSHTFFVLIEKVNLKFFFN